MPRGRSKSRKNRKGNEEPTQQSTTIEGDEVATGSGKKKTAPKDGPDSPGRGCGKLKQQQEAGESIQASDSTQPAKEEVAAKRASGAVKEQEINNTVADEKSINTPRRKKGRRQSQELNLNETREREAQPRSEEILKEQSEGEKLLSQKQKKSKHEIFDETGEIDDDKKEKNEDRDITKNDKPTENVDIKKKPGSNGTPNNVSVDKDKTDDDFEKDQNLVKDLSGENQESAPKEERRDEKKEETNQKLTQEGWALVSTKRQRSKKKSQERVLHLNVSPDTKDNTKENSTPENYSKFERDERCNNSSVDEQKSRDEKMTPGLNTSIPRKQNNDEHNTTKQCERKLSVHEIKRRFYTDVSKDSTYAGKISPSETGDDRADSITIRKSSKDKLVPGSEGDLVLATATTTELFIAPVGDKESLSSSSLCRAESPTEILSEDGSVKLKPKIVHGGLSDVGKALTSIEKDGTVFARGSYDTPKISVKQLRERLISSCSKLNDKVDEKSIEVENKEEERPSSEEMVIDKHAKGHEKKDYNVSLKERLESYRCQATREFQFSQTPSVEQEISVGTSIKELQSSFDKMHQPNNNFTADASKNKVKSVNDEIQHAQEYMMKCKACGKQVFLMERIMAEKSIWHKKCFRCSQCRKQLTVENYKSHDGILYCQLHYDQILKPKRAEGTISAHDTVVEELNIPPINVKSLFEKSANNIVENNSSQVTTCGPVEKSPKFLKRLRRFESKMSDQSDDEDEKLKLPENASQKVVPEKINKCTKEELDTNIETENEDDDGVKSVKSAKDSEGSKKSTPTSSPRNKTKSLHGHLKQLFEKHENESNVQTPQTPTRKEKKPGGPKKPKGITDRLQVCDVPKKPGAGQINSEDSLEVNEKMSKPLGEDSEIKLKSTNKDIDVSDTKGQTRDVHSVISYFNQQQ